MLTSIKNIIRKARDQRQLARCENSYPIKNLDSLSTLNNENTKKWLTDNSGENLWAEDTNRLNTLGIPEASGGVNKGDQQAIYRLVQAIKPCSVLEVGTHIGASTVHLACALDAVHKGSKFKLTSVDLVDVNSESIKQWEKFSSQSSPLNNLRSLGLENTTDFIVSDSIKFLSKCKDKFDFIFLDGDHSALTVYREVPLAINLLNPNGVILLHDYFPDNQPLWADGAVISGPFLAMARLNKELGIQAIPLGELPWPTKLGSNASSLAIVSQN